MISKQFRDDKLAVFYPAAVVCGVLSGLLQIFVGDPLFTALAVVVFTMTFGWVRPLRPWRWLLGVGLPIPVTMFIAQWINPRLHYTRASIAGSILIALPGFAGSYGGHIMRRMYKELYQSKQ
ncbi:MAG TPA: hypothetical protein VMU24_06690 [Candidatus Acidoferrales bacterium]|nr:hypothetical protein [Candidatus Acidoferrales bacterium]